MSDEDEYEIENILESGDSDSDDGEFPWYEELDGLATLHPSADIPTTSRSAERRAESIIGECNAQLIRRGNMRESFWANLEQPTEETSCLAFDLFDRYGRLDPELYEHDINKGTGVWGNELDHGDLLLFDVVKVDATHRRRGIGTKLVNAILEKTRKKVAERVGFFALARPGYLTRHLSHLEGNPAAMREAREAAQEAALGFWHALGFRRVGTSSWLAWTDSTGHPSRQLGISQDWSPPDGPIVDVSLSGGMERIFQKLSDPAVEAAECIDALTEAFPEDFEDAQWQRTDQDGNTLLHIASLSSKPELVSFLLSMVPRLAAVPDKEGHTALEALQKHLERERTRRTFGHLTLVTSDAFEGFSDSDIQCLAVLEHTAVTDPSSLSPQVIEAVSVADERIEGWARAQLDIAGIRKALRYKYGCTCGQCTGGFLSPRMNLALRCVAEAEHDNMQMYEDDLGWEWTLDTDHLLEHLPGPVKQACKTNKSVRVGFANMFSHIAKVLQQGKIPRERQVLDFYRHELNEWPPVTRNYLQRGGDVDSAANVIFEMAMQQDEWAGDGSHRDVFGENIDRLVACRNDHEFGFVAGMCGYKRIEPA